MNIIINGEKHVFPDDTSIRNMLALLELDSKKVAIERNLEIVSRSLYDSTTLMEGDEVEIVHFIGGG